MNTKATLSSFSQKCGIIIPVYNSAIYLKELLNQINETQKKFSSCELTIVIVDDGSNPPIDNQNIQGLSIEWIRHPQNQGKGAALKSGFNHFLKQDINPIMTMDSDLQHPPKFIPVFLKKYETGKFDVIIGSRKKDSKVMPFHRIISNTLTSFIISILIGQPMPDSQCGFRLFSREVIESVQLSENRFHLESEMLIKCGWKHYRIDYVPIPTIYNQAPSAIRNVSDTLNFMTLILKLLKERMIGNV